MTLDETTELEQLIDRYGMAHVLGALETICHEKAEHVQSTYDDRGMASAWRRGATRIAKAAAFADWPL